MRFAVHGSKIRLLCPARWAPPIYYLSASRDLLDQGHSLCYKNTMANSKQASMAQVSKWFVSKIQLTKLTI